MALRPVTAKWFELLIARNELSAALQILAATGAVELEAHSNASAAPLLPRLRTAVDEYKRLAQRHREFWPPADGVAAQGTREPEEIPAAALKQLCAWAAEADPVIDRLQMLAQGRAELERLQPLLAATDSVLPDLHLFTQAGPILNSCAYLLAAEPPQWEVPSSVIVQHFRGGERSYALAVGPAEQIAAFDETLSAHKARRLLLPAALPAQREAAQAYCRSRIEQINGEVRSLDATLQALHSSHGMSVALADLAFIEWIVQNVPQLELTEHFAWITGWTRDLAGGRIETMLNRQQLHYLLRYPDAPHGLVPPVVLRNPRWAQPFEMFSRLLGMPGANEADSSQLLAVVAPLMFGYMFGDVGQGAVLLVAGVLLRKRFPAIALLIPGGIAAIAFGFLFGSLCTSEAVLPALWLRPLDRPLALLGLSLVFGACVILMGFALDAVQHFWSGLATQWFAMRAGLVLCYGGMICAPLDIRALWTLPAGFGWYLIGSAICAPANPLRILPAAAAEALETLLQLAINTVSFVRIGAFALAHAGLGSAVSALAAAMGPHAAAWLVLAAGNVLIIAIEGLVVGIQTTRLVLFEFFIRFLQGSGRAFHPLAGRAAAQVSNPSSGSSST